jgi:hypothetical protein
MPIQRCVLLDKKEDKLRKYLALNNILQAIAYKYSILDVSNNLARVLFLF